MNTKEQEYYNKGRQFFLDNPSNRGLESMPFVWMYDNGETDAYNVAYSEGYHTTQKEYFLKLYKVEQLKAELDNVFKKYDLNLVTIDEIMFETVNNIPYETNLLWDTSDGFYEN